MINKDTKKQLLKDATKTIVFVDVYNVILPYTMKNNMIDKSKVKECDDEHVCMYNMLTKQYDVINVGMIGTWTTYVDTENPDAFDHKRAKTRFKQIESDVEECIKNPDIEIPPEMIIAMRCDINMSDLEFDLLKKFNLKYSLYELANPQEETMCDVRATYMNTIREHRIKAFEELDQMEDEAKGNDATKEDLEDIDTIKQMFRDIPEDVDLSEYKNLIELYEFWPSLLLPKPKHLLSKPHLELVKNMQTDKTDNFEAELMCVTDANELETLLAEMGNLNDYPAHIIRKIRGRIAYLTQYQDTDLI